MSVFSYKWIQIPVVKRFTDTKPTYITKPAVMTGRDRGSGHDRP